MEWILDDDYVDKRGLVKYAKSNPKEFELCFGYLDRLMQMLKRGVTLQQAMHSGFFSNEGEDVYRIGQQRKGMRETRLYIFARITGGVIKVLRIGDKSTQAKDVNWCHQWAREFKAKGQGV